MLSLELLLAIVVPIIGLALAGYNASSVLRIQPGKKELTEINMLIAEGGKTFLMREYKTILPTGVVLTILIWAAYYVIFRSGLMAGLAALSFALGAIGSAVAGYLGMYVTTRSAAKTAWMGKYGMGPALSTSFKAGTVMGLSLASIALLIVTVLYMAYSSILPTPLWAEALAPVAFGASLISLFIRVAGGIYTKAADWGADIVGKVEAGIPEDDPRNPGVIADNVGDNVGDCAGMASDVYESFVVVLAGALLLAAVFRLATNLIVLSIILATLTLIGTLVGVQVVRGEVKGKDLAAAAMGKLNLALYTTIIVSAILVAIYSFMTFPLMEATAIFVSDLLGMITAIVVLFATEYFTHYTFPPVRNIARQAVLSASNVIVAGYSYGLLSAIPTIFMVVAALGISYVLGSMFIPPYGVEGGIFGTAVASVGLLSLAGIVISLDSYGPVSDNANGLVEMTGMDEVRDVTDPLDAIGNTFKATTKGYAIASAGLAALILFIGFIYEVVERMGIPLVQAFGELMVIDPRIIIGALIGVALVYFFSSRTLASVGKAAGELVEEIRRQFRTKRILELWPQEKPDYNRAIDIVTRHALKNFLVPGLSAVIVPIVVGLALGWIGLVGTIFGVILAGFPRALLMANAGGAWDNAKKYIEIEGIEVNGQKFGKKSEPHKNAVVGDVVGDPFKDTTGPSLNPLIKVVNTVSIVFAPVIAMVSLINPAAGPLIMHLISILMA
ncbi:sodium-translocating pyrophosphatase [Vulcanisaeta distributa]|uniref:K(+)-insensitive pyrophosphate-energized proton pump n=1 Tax=Vulcanisaeta distributa (strain DSM 14429 / JCM 11212 / NBRC 100878 / IC-017) TaxID=572478 RepID=E1QTK6_VULDI|nr:sodium-translocating pyrophosphatase [Vulcanisaeta distributa]ADN49721.1 V-type H(+)-translocating pyrophosphatase [Vulcanisaeta distributa DSM 14429]